MLDYKKLKTEFTEKLAHFNEAMLLKWIKFDESRTILGKLLDGESIPLKYETERTNKINDIRENINILNNCEFAMAA